jgi:hypothetical protein
VFQPILDLLPSQEIAEFLLVLLLHALYAEMVFIWMLVFVKHALIIALLVLQPPLVLKQLKVIFWLVEHLPHAPLIVTNVLPILYALKHLLNITLHLELQ